DCFGLKFPGWVRPEHIKTFLRNCFIPNSTKKAVDPSLSTASPENPSGSFCRSPGSGAAKRVTPKGPHDQVGRLQFASVGKKALLDGYRQSLLESVTPMMHCQTELFT